MIGDQCMNKPKKVLGYILFLIQPFFTYAQTVELDTISVETEAFKEKDKAFLKQSATSIRSNFDTSTQSLDAVLRSVPGAFTQIDKSSGTVSVNVRGGTGFGRVNSMIDGVSQTFYASSADGGSRSSSTSQFGNLIDPGFLSSVDIDRGSFEGGSGANTLLGSANFKTIGVKDLVAEGRQVGFMGKYLWGSNATEPQILGVIALKRDFAKERWIGLLYGFSERHLSQDYRVGGGRKVTESSIDLTGMDEWDIEQTNTSPFDAAHVRQRPVSHIAKLEYADPYQQGTLSYREYKTSVGGRSIQNNNYQFNYHFSLPDNPWLDFNILGARNVSSQNYSIGAMIIGKSLLAPLSVKNKADTFDLSNIFHFELPFGATLKTRVGFNSLKSRYFKNRDPSEELNINLEDGETFDDLDCFGLSCYRKSLAKSSFQPDGIQKIKTFYIDNSLNWNIFTLDYNMNISRYKLVGTRQKYFPNYLQEISRDIRVAELNKNQVEADRLKGLYNSLRQQNCSYDPDDGYECPDINYPLTDYSQGRTYNYSVTFSSNFHDLFTPFLSYSRSHRAPNIKEVFFSTVSDLGVDTSLRPEKASTFQFGINGFTENLFMDGDKLGYKILHHRTHIKDFIYNVDNRAALFRNLTNILDTNITHKNYDKLVKINGFETELNYDAGTFYFNLAYARQKTNQPISFTDGSSRGAGASENERLLQGFGASKISILPRDYGSLEVGARFFDRKLTVSTTAKYYGKSQRVLGKPHESKVKYTSAKIKYVLERTRTTEDIPKQPIIFDVQVSYEPVKNLVLKAEIQNVFDKRYINPLDANNDSASQSVFNLDLSDKTINVLNNFARGRTYVFTLSYKY